MEGAGSTASLRKAASHWSLAGDKQLLDLLQNLHGRIVTKCQEANSSLEEMVNTLDTASISLQNVNNRFMALSNSQFVESRVYEDDGDVAIVDPPVKEPPKAPEPTSELTKLRDSLRILESFHEPVHIMDSDSDSGSDEEEERMVLKPKDLYSDRPLPYIIGSQQWRSKWHAGLVVEDSDTESDTSKANPPSEQYSDSEPERDDVQMDKPHASQRTISTNSSIGSELTIPPVGKPADIAAELARRLGGNIPHIPEPEPESPPSAPAPTTLYRPQQPATATIFSDEPPPLDTYQSDQSDQQFQSESEDDVFAELHKNTARKNNRVASGLVDQLFGNVSNVHGRTGGVEDDVDRGRQSKPSDRQPSPLFQETQDSELFADCGSSQQQTVYTETVPESSVKKPVGGISLFGNIHGAESIGAAILKRNQRKVSTSDEEVKEPQQISKINIDTEENKFKADTRQIQSRNDTQKDILNDLFSKPNKIKQPNKKIENMSPVKLEKPVNKKIDLFTDDLFDDIDDLFTNVKPAVKATNESVKKSLFDDDDDDLFANVAATSNKNGSKLEPKNISIFDSDDDLFSDENVENKAAKINTKCNKPTLNISDGGLFSAESDKMNKVVVKTVTETKANHNAPVTEKPTAVQTSEHKNDEHNLNSSETLRIEVKVEQDNILIKDNKIESIFGSDSDDDMFSDLKSPNNDGLSIQRSQHNTIPPIDNKVAPHRAENYDNVKKMKSDNNIIHNKNREINVVYKENEVTEEDPLIKQPLDSTKKFSTPHDGAKNNVGIDKSEDNNKKTDQLLIKSMKIDAKDKLCSNTNSNETVIKNKELPSILSNSNIPKTQCQSPLLFNEHDDLDDIFTKGPVGNKYDEIDIKLESDNSDQTSECIINEGIISDSQILLAKKSNEAHTEVIKESTINITPNENGTLFENIHESQIIKPDNMEKPPLETYIPEIFKSTSKELGQETDKNVIDSSVQESEAPSGDSFHHPISQLKESHEEKNEIKTEYDNIQTDFIQKESMFSDIKDTVTGEPDIFSDIFSDVPPDFEKPKESKKSKNVNALFDDDSDDEALFFKKNDNISDEKPDVSFTPPDVRLFHIFHDEPPAMDVDFTQKLKKPLGPDSQILSGETCSVIPPRINAEEQINSINLCTEKTQKKCSTFVDVDLEKNIEGIKPVGKLKPMNFNINVNTLLPGASPKKIKTYEQVDGQVISTSQNEDIVIIKDEESKMVKSVSFEGDPESEVLDNKLSKERAKIQVKRRPSSRRARKEAVRKSGIDFGDDSTDNSSSTDISKKDDSLDKTDVFQGSNTLTTIEKRVYTQKKDDVIVDNDDIKHVRKHNNYSAAHREIIDASKSDEKQPNSNIEKEPRLFNEVESNVAGNIKDSDILSSRLIENEGSESTNLTKAFNKIPNVKSKVVYILNDEDIFTDTKPLSSLPDNIKKISDNGEIVTKNKVLNIVDNDEELFKSSSSKTTNIGTLGNAYKNENVKSDEIDNFDSDEHIFKASQSKADKPTELNSRNSNKKDEIDKIEAKIDKLFVKTQSTKAKSSLFDDLSDDESELFGGKKSVKNSDASNNSEIVSTMFRKEVKLPKNDRKRSLFGDESDDDDNLFGVRTTKKESSQPLSKPKEVTSRLTEPVFEDPLSILGQEDDM